MNYQHLIERGVDQWNHWRDLHTTLIPDLRGTNLSQYYLFEANLSGVDLRDANLSHACLIGADLNHANLSRANLSGAYLSEANLSSANLCQAKLVGASLSRADLNHANLCQAQLTEADLEHTNLASTGLAPEAQNRSQPPSLVVKQTQQLQAVSTLSRHPPIVAQASILQTEFPQPMMLAEMPRFSNLTTFNKRLIQTCHTVLR